MDLARVLRRDVFVAVDIVHLPRVVADDRARVEVEVVIVLVVELNRLGQWAIEVLYQSRLRPCLRDTSAASRAATIAALSIGSRTPLRASVLDQAMGSQNIERRGELIAGLVRISSRVAAHPCPW